MKKLMPLLLAAALVLSLVACGAGSADMPNGPAQPQAAETIYEDLKDTPANGKVLVAYFSRAGENYSVGVIEKGNTEIVAEMLAAGTGADLFHIETVNAYPSAYEECTQVAQAEKDDKARPELTAAVDGFDGYDVVFLGYPIWWGDMPMAVYTFIESYDWSGKTVVPFCTHAGSGLSGTVGSIRNAIPTATVLDGLAVTGATAQNDRAAAQSSVDTFLYGLPSPVRRIETASTRWNTPRTSALATGSTGR